MTDDLSSEEIVNDETPGDAGDAGAEETGSSSTEPTAEPKVYDEAYVKRLRDENAKYRTRAKDYDEVYGDLDDEDRQTWLELAKAWKTDPKSGVEQMDRIVQAAREQFKEDVAELEEELDRPLTRREYQEMQAKAAQDAEDAASVARINGEAEKLGYTVGTRAHRTLLMVAAEEVDDGDLAKAHEILKAEKQAAIQEYLDAKVREAENGLTQPPAGNGTAPSGAKQIKTWDDAARASAARFEAARRK